MILPIHQNNQEFLQIPPPFHERRELTGQLIDFERALNNFPAQQLSERIRTWILNFKEAIKTENFLPQQERFIEELKNLLIDPIFHMPLDEDVLFGTDGLIYGRKTLLLYLGGFQEMPRFHLPRFLENPAQITVVSIESETIVPKLVRWLKEKQAFHPNQEIERAFANIEQMPAIPTVANERFRCMRENLVEQRLKTTLFVKLQEFDELLTNSLLLDNVTNLIRNWHRLFTEAVIASRNVAATQNEFVQLLQGILQDPIFQCILDAEPQLGSDGLTYSKKGLRVFFSEVPDEFRYRSPLSLENPAPFTVQPHPVATAMTQWLITIGCHNNNQDIEELYQKHLIQKTLADLPTEENLFITRLRKQEVERNRQANEELEAFADEAFQEIVVEIQKAFVPVHEKIQKDGQELVQEVRKRRQNDHKLLVVMLNRINELERQAQQFNERVDMLNVGIVRVNGEIAYVNNQNAKLSHSIAEARKALQDRENGWLKALLTAVAILGVCAIGTVILQSMAAKGIGMSATPLKGGGTGGMLNLFGKV